jgi:catechol 2,3-dioxygenase-like lactoylglutathione lyase family enzyme
MPQTTTRISAIGVVIVPVTDQDRALEFYTQKLGFEQRTDIPFGDGNRWIEVAPPGAETRIALMPPQPPQQTGVPTSIGFATDDIDALHKELRERDVDTDEVQRMGGPVPPLLFFRDQDGNTLFVAEE